MVEQYTDEIIQMFVEEYTPQEICQKLKLCKPTAEFTGQLLSNEIPPLEEEAPAPAVAPEQSAIVAAVGGPTVKEVGFETP